MSSRHQVEHTLGILETIIVAVLVGGILTLIDGILTFLREIVK